ncbi:type I-E CRISPR-associated protein Cse2/CasB [Marinomonas sp. A79]|uniref:Type I-E CRISPR-associated protein Cse2/CasB n=1 Tax=Marinomonas vulgaris TaxID=2823372 RepID=A0ABS5H7M0_9GAMM|nr:type I-E CRISPR-associated protein Cse2/CasB [Marinomonas vulgaris]MBR7887432.1 type I-E CRISPR-associated protein Cse2/CasB [Marinomonas vulgaris]
MSEKISFHPEAALGHLLLRWWQGLENDKGTRAELRRAHNLTAVALTAAYQRFYRQALSSGWPEDAAPWQNERLSAIVGLLAHVKSNDGRKLAEIMSEGERPAFSVLRFRRLLEAPTLDDVFLSLRRALPIIGHQANVHQIASDLLHWGDKTKKEWAYSYRWPAKAQA